ncbi:MAG: hypothetical protein FJ125_13830 [Deltaproteobacteria bacterium]|nr:hypothetical protein [Deltaproteobacteria bacterium]
MPLKKFRSVEEMAASELSSTARRGRIGAALAISDLCRSLSNVKLPPGLHRFRSLEEENSQMEAWIRAEARRFTA